MRGVGVAGANFVGLYRVFNDGDQPGFAWQRGGRFGSLPPGDRYELMHGPDRRRVLRFGDERVGEVDIGSSHLRLFYALQGERLPAGLGPDLYDVVEGVHRELVKKGVVTPALGSGKITRTRWTDEALAFWSSNFHGRRELRDHHPVASVVEAVLERHPLLGRVGQPGVPTNAELSFHESEVLRLAMASLRAAGVPSLPVHDSLLVPVSLLWKAEEELRLAFSHRIKEVTGSRPWDEPVLNQKPPEDLL
jgi:hypothetical protein